MLFHIEIYCNIEILDYINIVKKVLGQFLLAGPTAVSGIYHPSPYVRCRSFDFLCSLSVMPFSMNYMEMFAMSDMFSIVHLMFDVYIFDQIEAT